MQTWKMSEIHVISRSTISVESTIRVSLTPWDLETLFIEYSHVGLLYSRPAKADEAAVIAKSGAASLIDHLKASLQRTLHFFPLLTGRLTTTTSDGGAATCFFIEGNSGNENGALFVHATVNEDNQLTVADILNETYVPEIVRSFFPLNGVKNFEGFTRPLFAVQVTELVDGLLIGCSMNHLLMDGNSAWHFFNSWAEISRGDATISKLPFLNRDRVNLDLTGSNSIPIAAEHIKLHHDQAQAQAQAQSPPLKERVFRFSRKSIAKLKARANEEMVGSEGKISSLQAVIAHIWRSIIRCRFDKSTAADQETSFEISVGARQRLNPPLPEEYFGNAVFPGLVTLEASKMLENGLGWAAWQINRMLASSNQPDKVKEFYTKWIKNPTFLQSDGLPSNYFILISSPRFNVYGNDFGWGKPLGMRTGGPKSFDGIITVSTGLEEGSLEIEVCLFPQTLSALVEDTDFMEFITSNVGRCSL